MSKLLGTMAEQGEGGFRDYLEAKISIDDESINKKVFALFAGYLAKLSHPVILDVGTGTGAMIRRIIQNGTVGSAVFYGIDQSKDLLEEARRQLGLLFRERGFSVKGGDQIMTAVRGEQVMEVHLVSGNILDDKFASSLQKIPFDCITCNAFMDVVPTDSSLEVFASLLRAGGFFYATINYDGTTELLPSFEDRSFEEQLLSAYNRSMDQRTVGAKKTGGSRTGSLLFDQVLQHGFSVAGFGSSDWSIFPWNGTYTPQEEVFLNALLLTMYEEGLQQPSVDRYSLSAWYAGRSESVERKLLAFMTHQSDLLALKS